MRNIISLQLERSSCSVSLMVYSKCLVNIKVKNIDLSTGRNRLSFQEYITIVESRFGNDRENTGGVKLQQLMWMMRLFCHSYHNVENLLGPIYRWWLLSEVVVITSHSSCRMHIAAAQWNIGWMTKTNEKACFFWVFFGWRSYCAKC